MRPAKRVVFQCNGCEIPAYFASPVATPNSQHDWGE